MFDDGTVADSIETEGASRGFDIAKRVADAMEVGNPLPLLVIAWK